MAEFALPQHTAFVLETYDAAGVLYRRTVDELVQPVDILSATDRQFGPVSVRLRGLNDCPRPTVLYNATETWSCIDAARDMMDAIYGRASVILCKTLVMKPADGETVPASCFALVGGTGGEELSVANDDDTMVFLGLADIAVLPYGTLKRPDLLESQSLNRTTGISDAP